VAAAGTAPAGGERDGAFAREATADRKEVSLRSWGQRRGSVGRKGIGGGGCGGGRRGRAAGGETAVGRAFCYAGVLPLGSAPYLVLGLFDSWAGIDTGLSASVDF
jgi:hypothetical protein